MFCRKCGSEIPSDGEFCQNCGTRVVISHKENKQHKIIEAASNKPNTSGNSDSPENNKTNNEAKKNTVRITPGNKCNSTKVIIIGIAMALSIIGLTTYIIHLSAMCEYDGCSNKKTSGKDYCYRHACKASDCHNKKSYSGDYCYTHSCSYIDCYNRNVDGGRYCIDHTCATLGCVNEVKDERSKYCSDHYVEIDMRKKISNPSFGFTLNSAGGIKFNFSAKNSTSKIVKYVRFKAYLRNKVGDFVEDEITRQYYVNVEIVGPFSPGSDIRMNNEIIGYNDDLYRIDIDDITLIYFDGTSETGSFNYYTEKFELNY